MTAGERRQFVRQHRTAIFGYARQRHGPAMSVVYYVMESDDILVSTMDARAKAAAVRRNPKVSLCVLDEKWPPTYVTVFCDARVETDPAAGVDLMMRMAGVMASKPMPEEVRPIVAKGALAEQRVVLRLKPCATFETPPRHVYRPEDLRGLTHWLGTTLPWDAE